MLDIRAELHQNIQDSFNEAGVEIMSPHYASVRDGKCVSYTGQLFPLTGAKQSSSMFRFAMTVRMGQRNSRIRLAKLMARDLGIWVGIAREDMRGL